MTQVLPTYGVGANRGLRADKFSGASRARTDDLLAASQTLSQLSYSPAINSGSVAARTPSVPERRVIEASRSLVPAHRLRPI
jgi:hypothetical protein